MTKYYGRQEASDYIRIKYNISYKESTLAKLATTGGGPVFQRIGNRVVYTAENLDNFIENKLSDPMRSTSDTLQRNSCSGHDQGQRDKRFNDKSSDSPPGEVNSVQSIDLDQSAHRKGTGSRIKPNSH